MNFLQSCGSLFSGASLFEDPESSDDEDPWRSIQTHKGEVVLMRPEDAEPIDPLEFAPFPAVHTVLCEPPIKVIPGFLRDQEIDHVIALCQGRWKHSRVGIVNDDFKKGKESDVRTSSSCTLRRGETQLIRDLERRVSLLAGIDVSYLENLAPVRYMPGQQYRPHHDGSARPVTVFVYLNDLEEDAGGETYFPVLDIKFTPRKGCAIMWPNPLDVDGGGGKDNEDTRLLHAGLPPLRGVKYGLNCFFNCKVQDEVPSWDASSSWTSQSQAEMPVASPPRAMSFLDSQPQASTVHMPMPQMPIPWALPQLASPPRQLASPLATLPAWAGATPKLRCTAAPLSVAARSGATGIVACN